MDCFPIVLLVFCGIFTCPLAVDITDVDDYDPGSCDKSNVLQVVSLKDKNDEKKLWICSNENGTYLWKPVDGHAFHGEYLFPGYDCSDILNNEPNAKNGFYWVTFKTKIKRKVWCDMTTDGGGYMLVARKHDAKAWDVPSKDQPAEPKSSETYWTSQLGDAPMLDFMIQLSTGDTFKETKAQWSYRLKSKRALEQLMITDRGCDLLTPGIGDIAYVKDLMTEEIVTTTFECSVFGTAHSTSFGKLGWSMMNECLKKPCTGAGYIHFAGQAMAFDDTGVFSYSVSNTKSGIKNDATAYIGCLYDTCCGCFGPVGGKGNYCNASCSGTRGTIVDSNKTYTWVWVRSTLPKRIWNRCMEYQQQDSNGQDEWYILIGDSVVPQKGRCPNLGKLRLNSGVVVAPDSAAAKKVPKIAGLLEWRKDQNQLYVRGNKTWKSLPDKKEVNEKLAQLEQNIDDGLAEMKKNLSLTMDILKTLYHFSDYKKFAHFVATNPQCERYKWLSDGDRYLYRHDSTNSRLCDTHLSGWYRFGGAAGTKMYEGCPGNYYYCQTVYPGYLTGGHPGVNEGIVTRTACFYAGGCCAWSQQIKVLNCGSYFVYELNSTPSCNARYCGSN